MFKLPKCPTCQEISHISHPIITDNISIWRCEKCEKCNKTFTVLN